MTPYPVVSEQRREHTSVKVDHRNRSINAIHSTQRRQRNGVVPAQRDNYWPAARRGRPRHQFFICFGHLLQCESVIEW